MTFVAQSQRSFNTHSDIVFSRQSVVPMVKLDNCQQSESSSNQQHGYVGFAIIFSDLMQNVFNNKTMTRARINLRGTKAFQFSKSLDL